MDKELQDEVYNYFYEAKEDNIVRAIEELQDKFEEDEVCLIHIKPLSEVANQHKATPHKWEENIKATPFVKVGRNSI